MKPFIFEQPCTYNDNKNGTAKNNSKRYFKEKIPHPNDPVDKKDEMKERNSNATA